MNVKEIRRNNLRLLVRFMGVSEVAKIIGRSQSQVSHLISEKLKKGIGDKLATHIEKCFGKPPGWIDVLHCIEDDSDGNYNFYAKRDIKRVPLVTWQEAEAIAPNFDSINLDDRAFVVTMIDVSQKSFALKIDGDSMESHNGGMSFPNGAILIVDPELPAKNNSYVVVKSPRSGKITFKQLIIDGSKRYLKPINSRYPISEIDSHCLVCGIVKSAIIEI